MICVEVHFLYFSTYINTTHFSRPSFEEFLFLRALPSTPFVTVVSTLIMVHKVCFWLYMSQIYHTQYIYVHIWYIYIYLSNHLNPMLVGRYFWKISIMDFAFLLYFKPVLDIRPLSHRRPAPTPSKKCPAPGSLETF